MTQGGQALARTITGIIGNIISFCMFVSPVTVFKRIIGKKTTEDFHPHPYLATTMNCLFWVFYGLPFVHPDSTLIITINGIGLFLETCYLSIFFFYTTKKNRGIILLGLLLEAIVLAGIICITMLCFHTHKTRSMFVGIVCIVFGIIMYASPLSVLKTVIKTRSPEYMPFWLCVAGFLNGITWFTYANLKTFDLYVAIGNGIGVLLGLIQLLVYAYYSFCGSKPAFNDEKPSGVQLRDTNFSPV